MLFERKSFWGDEPLGEWSVAVYLYSKVLFGFVWFCFCAFFYLVLPRGSSFFLMIFLSFGFSLFTDFNHDRSNV